MSLKDKRFRADCGCCFDYHEDDVQEAVKEFKDRIMNKRLLSPGQLYKMIDEVFGSEEEVSK